MRSTIHARRALGRVVAVATAGLLGVAMVACSPSHHAASTPAGESSGSPSDAPSSPAAPASGSTVVTSAARSATAPPTSAGPPISASASATSLGAGNAAGRTAAASASAHPSKPPASKPPISKPPISKPTASPKPTPTTATAAPAKPAPPPLLVAQLASVGNAQQVVVVTSANWSTDVATLQTFEKDAGSWRAVFPAMPAFIGRAGFSATKREGDLKTPVGKFGFGTMFGQRANPGVKFPYRVADSQSVWVDDQTSPYYNTWQENAALSGEHLASAGFATAYRYAVDIAYNTAPVVPGKGSAIFLHVSTGGGTAGCVSVAQSNLLLVLRWLDPARSPVIVLAPSSAVRQY